ncbi:transmembrane ascorbate-dependent reductase CYB561-like [Amphiura filiformis]|uniref:transmembrane ascorbate-dependent reductase CYB561-like n=1 Tax=Amphiura filiformis TaxID=82378 RepID=UPI003B220204
MNSSFVILVGLAELAGLAGMGLTITWMIKYLGGFGWDGFAKQFNVHPLMMTVGMIFINGNALMLYRVTLSLNLPRIIVKFCHLGLQLLAAGCGSIGLAAVFGYHKNIGASDLYSFHSWVGLTTFIMFGIQLLFGFLFFILFFFLLPRSENLRGRFLPIHVFFGKMILILATITTCMGIQEKAMFAMADKYKDIPVQALIAHAAGISFTIFTFIVMYIMSNDSYKAQSRRDGYHLQANST